MLAFHSSVIFFFFHLALELFAWDGVCLRLSTEKYERTGHETGSPDWKRFSKKSKKTQRRVRKGKKTEHYENCAVPKLLMISSPIFCSRAFTKVTDVGCYAYKTRRILSRSELFVSREMEERSQEIKSWRLQATPLQIPRSQEILGKVACLNKVVVKRRGRRQRVEPQTFGLKHCG